MHDPETDTTPRLITSIWPAIVLLVIAIAALVTTFGYSTSSARFPRMVAGAMIVLALLDFWGRTGLPGAGVVETFGGADFKRREMMHNPTFSNQMLCVGWIVLSFVLMAVIGILAAAPIFCVAFVQLRGGRSLAVSASVGLGVLVFLFAVFEWALDYELYRGMLFARGGMSSW